MLPPQGCSLPRGQDGWRTVGCIISVSDEMCECGNILNKQGRTSSVGGQFIYQYNNIISLDLLSIINEFERTDCADSFIT